MTGMANGKVVFIAHAYCGDPEVNLFDTERYIRYAIKQGQHPCCPWYAMVRSLDDMDGDDRERGVKASLEILSRCDELWVCGDEISPGVELEIDRANALRLPVVYVDLDSPAYIVPLDGRG